MAYMASFTDARINFTQITDLVMNKHISVTVFKRNKPAFKIVPITDGASDETAEYLSLVSDH
ncbi:type II toxin-antitoxin system prevent-host-death family antitoxin [Bifidobacterium gallicum]|nr:type II toxin-antitoxin system prevent-host-death family antitoxin [Bifidobacterium gallicum]KFI58615.1 toxin-antitoxin system, antitoxin component, PHD family [Bifidobacterium gallicum DSM 20093 = LMG 11596]